MAATVRNAARERLETAAGGDGVERAGFALVQPLYALGERDRARRWIRKALNVDPGNLAMRYALAATLASQFNDGEAALDVLDPFTEALMIAPHLRLLELDPSWASIRQSPRFEAVVKRSRKRVDALDSSSITC